MAAPTREEFNALQQRLQEQEVILNQLHNGNKTLQAQLDSFLYQTQQQALTSRGTRGLDFQLYQQFMAAQLASALEALHCTTVETIHSTLRLERVEILVKQTEEALQKLRTVYSTLDRYMLLIDHSKTLLERVVESGMNPAAIKAELDAIQEKAREAERKMEAAEMKLSSVEAESEAFAADARNAMLERLKTATVQQRLPTEPRQLRTFPSTVKKCFYSASIGNPGQTTDKIQPFTPIPGWDYILFTNRPPNTVMSWKVRQVDRLHPDPAVDAKLYKWLSHRFLADYDLVVWIDSYLSPIPKLGAELEDCLYRAMIEEKQPIVHRPHGERDCIWDECDAVVKARRATPEAVQKNRALLTDSSMPRHWGLFDTNVVAKLHMDPVVRDLGESVANVLRAASNRDQLAITYVYYTKGFHHYGVKDLLSYMMKSGTHVRIPAYL